jgi:hypothetical protein
MSMFASLLPHASCFEVQAGHMAPISHPALVNPIFERFIEAWTRANVARSPSAVPDRSLATLRFSELTSVVRGRAGLAPSRLDC